MDTSGKWAKFTFIKVSVKQGADQGDFYCIGMERNSPFLISLRTPINFIGPLFFFLILNENGETWASA